MKKMILAAVAALTLSAVTASALTPAEQINLVVVKMPNFVTKTAKCYDNQNTFAKEMKNAIGNDDSYRITTKYGTIPNLMVKKGIVPNTQINLLGRLANKTIEPSYIPTLMKDYELTLTKKERRRHFLFLGVRKWTSDGLVEHFAKDGIKRGRVILFELFRIATLSNSTNLVGCTEIIDTTPLIANNSTLPLIGTEEPAFLEYEKYIFTGQYSKAKNLVKNYISKMLNENANDYFHGADVYVIKRLKEELL